MEEKKKSIYIYIIVFYIVLISSSLWPGGQWSTDGIKLSFCNITIKLYGTYNTIP